MASHACHCNAPGLDVCVLAVGDVPELLLQVCCLVGARKAVAVGLLACLPEGLDLLQTGHRGG